MEQHNYSYNPLPPSTAPNQSNQQAPNSLTQGGISSPRTLQPLPPLTSASQPYIQAQQYLPPSYGNGFEYRPSAEPQYTHQPPMALPSMSSPASQDYGPPPAMDTTGQIPPPGMRPRLTTSVFEEEGSLCFQVDVDGICVARREDNHMINGTKLLNVAKMTRGRRDGILKAEKQKTVVKIGPMHLKGVWIPYERALLLANQEKITELLYPLFVHNIGNLLYHPTNVARPLPLPNTYQRGPAHLPSIQYVEVNEGGHTNQRV